MGKEKKEFEFKGNRLADAVTEAFNKKSLTNKSGLNSFQKIIMEQARLNSMLWGGAALVGVSMYFLGKLVKKE